MRRLLLPLCVCVLFLGCDDDPGAKDVIGTEDHGELETDADVAEQTEVEPDADVAEQTEVELDADVEPELPTEVDGSEEIDESELPDDAVDLFPTESCAEIDADPCLSNLDCGGAELCRVFSAEAELRCCVDGTRGTLPVGEPCSSDEACDFGRCIARDDGARFCSGECGGDLDCPGFMSCSDFFGWCYPKDAGWLPTSCFEVNLDQCFYNDNCGDDERCENVGAREDEVLCCTVGPRGTKPLGEDCVEHTECAFGRCYLGLCTEYCDFDIDPCPAADLECDTLAGYCVAP